MTVARPGFGRLTRAVGRILAAALTAAGRRAAVLLSAALLSAAAQPQSPPAAAIPASPTAASAVAGRCPPQAAMPGPEAIAAAQRSAVDRGFLWKISRDGRDSWLYGTVHVGRFEWLVPGPFLMQALRETEVLALELDPADPAVQAALTAPAPAGLQLPPATAARLARERDAACVPEAMLSALPHPFLQAVVLGLMSARWEGLDPAFGIDIGLAGIARSLGRPLVALETAELQLAAMLPDDPATALKMTDEMLAMLADGRQRRVLARLAGDWEAGRFDDLASYETWCDCVAGDDDRRMMARINDDRNPHLADAIAALHAGGRRVLAAVGALHMTGPAALPKLLAQRGFRVEPVVFVR
jgi:uncharacterized protein YbaP (TraB family)